MASGAGTLRSLVAGASGFLGSNLSKALLEKGHEVFGLDNGSTSKKSNVQDLQDHKNFHFIEGSVLSLDPSIVGQNFDYIFHFASPASPPKYQELGLETIKANTDGTENLIKLAIQDSARLIFASTSEIYGDPLVYPQHEQYWGNVNPIGPRSVYDESKRLGETLVSFYKRERSLDSVIVRIFNTYGPGMSPYDGRVVSTFIRQALTGQPFGIFGDGTQKRSFCYVSDLITGIIAAALSTSNGPINLGNPQEITLNQLAEEIAEALGTEPSFDYLELPVDDPIRRCPDISLARQVLNWEPRVNIQEGILRTAEWMKDQLP